MSTATHQSLSAFGEAAIALDTEMRDFERLGSELANLTIDSDKGMNRGGELLTELGTCRERLEVRMREMARTLEQARERNERTEQTIALRTQVWQQRRMEAELLLGRFKTLGESVHLLNATVTELRRPTSEEITPEERERIGVQLNQAAEPLATLVEEAKNLVQDARSANMKTLERNADTLRQALQAARNRLNLIGERRSHPDPSSQLSTRH